MQNFPDIQQSASMPFVRIAKLSSSERFIVDGDMSAILIGPTKQALIVFLDVFKLVANFFFWKVPELKIEIQIFI